MPPPPRSKLSNTLMPSDTHSAVPTVKAAKQVLPANKRRPEGATDVAAALNHWFPCWQPAAQPRGIPDGCVGAAGADTARQPVLRSKRSELGEQRQHWQQARGRDCRVPSPAVRGEFICQCEPLVAQTVRNHA